MEPEELVAGVLGLLGLTQIAFIGLKILNIIQWSWIWVLSPVWVPVVLFIAVGLLSFAAFIVQSGGINIYFLGVTNQKNNQDKEKSDDE